MRIKTKRPSLFMPLLIASVLTIAPVVTLAQSPVGTQASAASDLSVLLDGVENQCRYNSMLENFWRALAQPDTAATQLGAGIQSAVGPISVADEVDFLMYSVPVQGHWHQVPVRQIQFGLGKGNGIHVLLIEFDGPAAAANKIFGPIVERSRTAMAADTDNPFEATTELLIEDDHARLICDLST